MWYSFVRGSDRSDEGTHILYDVKCSESHQDVQHDSKHTHMCLGWRFMAEPEPTRTHSTRLHNCRKCVPESTTSMARAACHVSNTSRQKNQRHCFDTMFMMMICETTQPCGVGACVRARRESYIMLGVVPVLYLGTVRALSERA